MRITPNQITLARIGLIPVFVVALLSRLDSSHGATIAFIIFAFAAATDGLDGWLARSRKQVTNLGKGDRLSFLKVTDDPPRSLLVSVL